MKKLFAILLVLLMWPWWTLRACVLSAAGVALLVVRAICDEWGRAPVRHSKPAQSESQA